MAITARFWVTQVTKHGYPNGTGGWAEPAPAGNVLLQPVIGKENEPWASATPSGKIELTVRGSAFPWFEERLGKTCAITFDDAPDDKES